MPLLLFFLLVTLGQGGAQIIEGAVGSGMNSDICFSAKDPEEAVRSVSRMIRKGDVLLVKGSRGMKMERVVELLVEELV